MFLDCWSSVVVGLSSNFSNFNVLPFVSLERDGRCATTSTSAGQTSGCPKVLRLCWISVSMYFRGGKLQSRAWGPVGRGPQGGPLWLCTAVPGLAEQVRVQMSI